MTLADYTEQASVTNWPVRIALVLLVVALIVLALWGMLRGWRRRERSQAWVPEPADAPPPDARLSTPVDGLVLGTSVNGDWLDRIVVYDLGVRSRGSLSYGAEGVWLAREGARDLFLPSDAIEGVRVDRGVAGTVRGTDSVIVLTWRAADALLDTGFRADSGEDHATVLDGLMATYATDASGEGR